MSTPLADRSIGCLMGVMCGDVLGAHVEGRDARTIFSQFPAGLQDFQQNPRGFGCYTDDSQMTLALAQSLVDAGKVHPEKVARAYARAYQPFRGYGANAHKVLRDLQKPDADWRRVALSYMPEGSWGNGTAMRISPVAIAYRNAPADVLYRAVKDACISTHTHPLAIDAAFILAAAMSWLVRFGSPATDTASARLLASSLLGHVIPWAKTDEMRGKLQRCLEAVSQINYDHTESWSTFLLSEEWGIEWKLQLELSGGNWFQIKATDAVAVALCAFIHHGLLGQASGRGKPEDAVVAAVHYGGDTDTTASMSGACVGCLHGTAGIPERWVRHLENNENRMGPGRDAATMLAQQLAQMDVTQ